jgi:hypothetical protein
MKGLAIHGLVEEKDCTQPSMAGLIIISPRTRQFPSAGSGQALPGYFQSRLTALKSIYPSKKCRGHETNLIWAALLVLAAGWLCHSDSLSM